MGAATATASHVLVVDDEPTVSEVVAGYLADDGHRVTRVADGIEFRGTEVAPIRLESRNAGEIWSGVMVLAAPRRSLWEHVQVQGAGEVARGGWTTTGGVTFYRSPVTLLECAFEGGHAEDALNVFGTDVELDGVRFLDCPSDAFDGSLCIARQGVEALIGRDDDARRQQPFAVAVADHEILGTGGP